MSGYPPGYGVGGYGVGGLIGGVPSKSYYLSLVTSEYKAAPNFLAWMSALLQPISDLATTIALLATPAFDIAYAVGEQLDVLGQLIGAGRTVSFQPSGSVSPVLDDPTYRILLMAKIAQNQWDGKIGSLYPLWGQLFPGGRIAILDNQNMTATIILSGAFTSILQDLITNGLIIPRPEGVMYTYTFPVLPALGFDSAPGYIAGFGSGHWAG